MIKYLRDPRIYILFVIALLPRLFGLDQFLTSDENTNIFLAGSDVINAFLSGELRNTYWHFYPGVTLSWLNGLGFAGLWLLAQLSGDPTTFLQILSRDILDVLVAVRLPYALLTAVFVPLVYVLVRQWLMADGGRSACPTAVFAALLVALEPFFIAHSRVVHGDAPVAVFMVLSMLALFLFLRDGQRGWFIFSAVMGGLAGLTKAPGQLIAVLAIVTIGGEVVSHGLRSGRFEGKRIRRRLLDVALWGAIAFATFFALFPAMWVDPVGVIGQMLNETFGKVDAGHLVFFMGQPTLDPGPWFYPYVTVFRLTPVSAVGWLLSLGLLAREIRRRPANWSLAALLWYVVVALFLFGLLSPKKQDRYLLPLFPVINILAALGWAWLLQALVAALQPKWRAAPALFIIGPLLVIVQAVIVWHWHPYTLAYFNPMLGGLPRAVETTLVGWGEGLAQAADYLNRQPNAAQAFVAVTPSQTFLPYFQGTGENFYTNDVAARADYVVIYRAQQQRLAPSPEIVYDYQRRQAVHTIEIMGVPYAWIYANEPLIFDDVPPWGILTNIGLGDVMRLAGYRLLPASDQLTVDLVWHALPAIEQATGPCVTQQVEYFTATVCPRLDYTVSLRLLNAKGETVAQHDSFPANGLLPTSQWRVNDYVQDRHTLTLPAGKSPGEYTLQVVVYQSETGEVLAGPLDIAKGNLLTD